MPAPRLVCSDAERRYAVWAHDDLRARGHEAWVETLWIRPQRAAGVALACVVAAVGGLVALGAPVVGLVMAAAGAASLLVDAAGGAGPLRWVFPRRATQVVLVAAEHGGRERGALGWAAAGGEGSGERQVSGEGPGAAAASTEGYGLGDRQASGEGPGAAAASTGGERSGERQASREASGDTAASTGSDARGDTAASTGSDARGDTAATTGSEERGGVRVDVLLVTRTDVPRSGLARRFDRVPGGLWWLALAALAVVAAAAARVGGVDGTLLGAAQLVPTVVLLVAATIALDSLIAAPGDGAAEDAAVAAVLAAHEALVREPPPGVAVGLLLGAPDAVRLHLRRERLDPRRSALLVARPGPARTRHHQWRAAADAAGLAAGRGGPRGLPSAEAPPDTVEPLVRALGGALS
jgi:hypothetical protein